MVDTVAEAEGISMNKISFKALIGKGGHWAVFSNFVVFIYILTNEVLLGRFFLVWERCCGRLVFSLFF